MTAAAGARHGTGRMLVVDDEEINRMILANLFEGHFEVEEASNGREALDALLANPSGYVAVLLDVMMPEMDGMEVLGRLAPTGLLERVPVFLITAERGSAVMEEAYRLGVMDFIGKPIVPYVVTALSACSGGSSSRRASASRSRWRTSAPSCSSAPSRSSSSTGA